MSNIRSRTLDERGRPQAATPPGPRRRDPLAPLLALGLLAFGAPAWIAGARYTVDGWVAWLNTFAGWLGLDARLAPVRGGELLLVAAVVGLVYSVIEVRYRPVRLVGGRLNLAPPRTWVVWGLVIATDVGSTYTGIRIPPGEGAPRALQQIAASEPVSAAAAAILTFAPEWLIMGAKALLF